MPSPAAKCPPRWLTVCTRKSRSSSATAGSSVSGRARRAAGESIAESVYDIPIRRGIRFAPHPAFARDAAGNYVYHALGRGDTADKHGIKDLARFITYGASPRATIGMIEGAKALAMLRGRRYVLPEDMTDLVPDVMRHRVVLSYEALAENITADALVQRVLAKVPPPDKPLAHAPGGGTAHG